MLSLLFYQSRIYDDSLYDTAVGSDAVAAVESLVLALLDAGTSVDAGIAVEAQAVSYLDLCSSSDASATVQLMSSPFFEAIVGADACPSICQFRTTQGDTAQIFDTGDTRQAMQAPVLDLVVSTDSCVSPLLLSVTPADVATTSDAVAAAESMAASFLDAGTGADACSNICQFRTTQADNAITFDEGIVYYGSEDLVRDSASSADAGASIQAMVVGQVDSAQVLDSDTSTIAWFVAVADSIAAADGSSASAARQQSVFDLATAQDLAVLTFVDLMFDAATGSDFATTQALRFSSVTEALMVTDSVINSIIRSEPCLDAVTSLDNGAAAVDAVAQVQDLAANSDTPLAWVWIDARSFEICTVADLAAVLQQERVSVSDLVFSSDSSAVYQGRAPTGLSEQTDLRAVRVLPGSAVVPVITVQAPIHTPLFPSVLSQVHVVLPLPPSLQQSSVGRRTPVSPSPGAMASAPVSVPRTHSLVPNPLKGK